MTIRSIVRYALTPILMLSWVLALSLGLSSTQAQQATATPAPTRQVTRTPMPPTPTPQPCIPAVQYVTAAFHADGMHVYFRNTTSRPIYLTGFTIGVFPDTFLVNVVAGLNPI